MNVPVIYKISSLISDKIYVGSALRFNTRRNRHLSDLRLNRHPNAKIQAFVNKHGIDSLIFSIIEECNSENILEREQYYIDSLIPWFNIRIIANSPKGRVVNEETRVKMSVARNGRKHTEETKKAIGIANSKRIFSNETLAKYKLINKGRIHSEERRKNHSLAMKGRKLSKEHKAKIGEANRKRIIKQSTKDAIGIANSKRVISEETRRKISENSKKMWEFKRLNKI